jgi:hypothetical protein
MEQKMESGELNQDSLKSEAEGMMGKMGENPMFKNMMRTMDPTMQQGMNATGSAVPTVDSDVPPPEPELTREEKQKILREKINEKKLNRQ